ncbi:putative HTH-type transcriptional regulator YahB [Carnimonas sp. R-84981]|uniref:LysR family transcriptional regulator n=1 Tax=Carnimonas bestiolae TaxID=3402172 RepID=UPI003EDC4428
MMPTLEQLNAFVTAADCGSFSAAARQLSRAQSHVSTQVAHLEITLGFALFDRSGRMPQLTDNGRRVLIEARQLLAQSAHLMGVAQRLDEGVEARIRLALDEFYPERLIGGVLSDFAERFPSVELELHFPLLDDVSQMIEQNEADLGVLCRTAVLDSAIEARPVGRVPLRLVCAKEHPLAQQPITYQRLVHYRQLIVATRGRRISRQSMRIAADAWWVESHYAMLELVKHGVGWALMSDHVIASSPTRPWLTTPDAPGIEHSVELEIGWHRQRGLGPAAQWLAERFTREPLPQRWEPLLRDIPEAH